MAKQKTSAAAPAPPSSASEPPPEKPSASSSIVEIRREVDSLVDMVQADRAFVQARRNRELHDRLLSLQASIHSLKSL